MLIECFIKTMILIMTYLSFGITLSVLGLYIRQVREFLKAEVKPEYLKVIYIAKILVFTGNLMINIGCITIMVITLPWLIQIRNAIGHLVTIQPAFGVLFLGLSALPFLYLRRLVIKSSYKE